MGRLQIVFPYELRRKIVLGDSILVLGRQQEGVGNISHGTVSRKHLELRWSPAGATHEVTDVGSRNGSWLNGHPLSEVARSLKPNDLLRIGDVLAVYESVRSATWPDDSTVSREAIRGESISAGALRYAIADAAKDAAPALIMGETGTGKEFVAKELHRLGGRKGNLVSVNCAALSPQLIESQLFGHRQGAFTGASTSQTGLFCAADGGSLFLDEIGELPLDLQPKLLRAIETGEVTPVGSAEMFPVDAWILAATNRELPQQVENGMFRRDLYARLSIRTVRVPPLRERRADIMTWFQTFWSQWSARQSLLEVPCPVSLSPNLVEQMLLYAWPENLRALDRLVHEWGALVRAGAMVPAELPEWTQTSDLRSAEMRSEEKQLQLRKAKPHPPSREELLEVLRKNHGSIRAAAKHYQRERKQIYRWMASLGIHREDSGQDPSGGTL